MTKVENWGHPCPMDTFLVDNKNVQHKFFYYFSFYFQIGLFYDFYFFFLQVDVLTLVFLSHLIEVIGKQSNKSLVVCSM